MAKYVIFQKPNMPAIVAFIAWVLTHVLPYGQLNFIASLIFFGAAFTWAWLEMFQGVNLFRQLLGVVVMVVLIVGKIS